MTVRDPLDTVAKKDTGIDTSKYVLVASVQELKKHGQLTKWVENHDILVYEWNGEIKAISNVCRHFGGPVGYRKHKDGKFTCLWHNWQFDCNDGSCTTNPGLSLRQYNDLVIFNGLIYVNLLG